jgi:YidC/Oxa1 family membrane protein insertase
VTVAVLGPIEDVLREVLEFFHVSLSLPWAWAIVALTVSVRMLLVPLTIKQIHSMQRLQRYAPQMKEIQRKYKGDRQRLNEELMRFYKENQINPASSCLPLLAQLPIFFALFFVLDGFEEEILPDYPGSDLTWLSFVPNITADANTHWSGFLLLGVYAISQVASTFFMSTTMDKTQRTLLLVLPILFLPIVLTFPTGLVLYWMTTNLWTVGQGLITRRLVPKTPAPTPRRTSRTPPRERAEPEPAPAPAAAEATPAGQRQVRKVKRKKKKKARR